MRLCGFSPGSALTLNLYTSSLPSCSEAAQKVKESVTGAAADVQETAREVSEVRRLTLWSGLSTLIGLMLMQLDTLSVMFASQRKQLDAECKGLAHSGAA